MDQPFSSNDALLIEIVIYFTQDEELARQLVELGYRGSGEVRTFWKFHLVVKACLLVIRVVGWKPSREDIENLFSKSLAVLLASVP